MRDFHGHAIGQFYHVGVDTKQPYNVYGAQQDNSTVILTSSGSGDFRSGLLADRLQCRSTEGERVKKIRQQAEEAHRRKWGVEDSE